MKLTLDNKTLANDFFEGAILLGIVAPVKDYQLCWNLNRMLGMDFRLNNDLEIQLTKKKRNYFFSVFEFCEPTGSLSHYVYNNRFDGEYLLPEFKHLDFLWLMKGDVVSKESLHQTMNSIKEIASVQLVAELTSEKIRNKEHLVF